MDYEFLNTFQPKIEYVTKRDEVYWEVMDYKIEREATNSHVLAYVYDGNGGIEFNGQRYSLHSGALFCVPSGSHMKIVSDKTSSLKFYSVLFHYGQFRWEGDVIQWTPDLKNPILEKTVTYFDESPILYEMYRDLFKVWNHKGIGYEWRVKLKFQILLDSIVKMVQNSSEHKQRNALIIEQTIEYIRNHFHERLDRGKLAERASLSKGHFATLFKQYTGYSVVEYITRLRLDHAKILLRETSLPVYKISEKVGYPDSFYFTRQFSKDAGMSPRDFRQLHI